MQEVQAILPDGTLVQGRYVIEKLLGRGGFGAVYLVRDQRTRGNLFALKEIIDSSKQERERFAFECEILKKLDHAGLPRVYRVFDDENSARSYMLMDYIEGPNLEVLRLQQAEKRFSVEAALDIMAPIFAVVSYLHQQKPPIIHRDVKPANIIVPATAGEAVLVDLGIAKEYTIDATTTAVRRCSPGYGAPEQYDKGTNMRTDVYGLAATLYVLLTGAVPSDAFYRMAQLGGRREDPLVPVSQLIPATPLPVSDALHKAMAINSAERFTSVDEFWQTLNPYRADLPEVLAPVSDTTTDEPFEAALTALKHEPVTVVTRPVRENNGRRGVFFLLFTFLMLLALVGGLFIGKSFMAVTSSRGQAVTPVTTIPGKKVTATSTQVLHAKVTPIPRPRSTPKPVVSSHPSPTAIMSTPVPPTPVPPTPIPPTPALPASGGILHLAGTYSGTITDVIGGSSTSATMTLSPIYQTNTAVSGYATINYPLQGSNNFTGTITASGTISFQVDSFGGHLPLYFYGQVAASGGAMSGSYCSYNNGGCDRTAGGYGTWYVASA